MDEKLVDRDGTVHERSWTGRYDEKHGVFGREREVGLLGNPSVAKDLAGNPVPATDLLGNRVRSSTGVPLFRYAPSGGTPLERLLGWLIYIALVGAFILAWYLLKYALLLLFHLLRVIFLVCRAYPAVGLPLVGSAAVLGGLWFWSGAESPLTLPHASRPDLAAVIPARLRSASAAPQTQAAWYEQTARRYADAYRAGRPGFGLPYRFSEVTGVPESAPRARLVEGLMHYLRVAIYTGAPAYGGILAWARADVGELSAGSDVSAWFATVAERYATAVLAGSPGFELTPSLAAAGDLDPAETDLAVLTSGLERALRAAVYLGTPELGGVLDWARRAVGELPPR